MSQSFLQDVRKNQRNYSKINFNTTKIKNREKIHTAYKIPNCETILAFVKSSVLLFPLSVDGNIITDKAIYNHPSHDDWAKDNRLPFSELCSYVIMQANENAEVVMVKSDESRTIRGNTIFGKNTAGAEILQFLLDLQQCFVNKYDWAANQRQIECSKIIATAQQMMKKGKISENIDEALNVLQTEYAFTRNVITLRAEYVFRHCNKDEFLHYINSIQDSNTKNNIRNNTEKYLNSLKNDLSDINLNMDADYLQTAYNNITTETNKSKDDYLILAYICIRLRREYTKNHISKFFGEGMLRNLDQFKGRYYNFQMQTVYSLIKQGISPSDTYVGFTDSLGLTLLHYAIIQNQPKVIDDLLSNECWSTNSPVKPEDEAHIVYDYNITASNLSKDYRKKICLNTCDELVPLLDSYKDAVNECNRLERNGEMMKSRKNNLYSLRSRAARGEIDCDIRDIEEELDNVIAEMNAIINEMSKLYRIKADIEQEIDNFIDRKLMNAQHTANAMKMSHNPFIRFMSDIYESPDLLYHIIKDVSEVYLYVYNTMTFVVPTDVKLKLMYYDNPFGEIKNGHLYNEYTDNKSEKLYGSSWYSPQAHKDINVLKSEYHALAKKYHPDVSKDKNSKDIFQEITEEKDNILESISL